MKANTLTRSRLIAAVADSRYKHCTVRVDVTLLGGQTEFLYWITAKECGYSKTELIRVNDAEVL